MTTKCFYFHDILIIDIVKIYSCILAHVEMFDLEGGSVGNYYYVQNYNYIYPRYFIIVIVKMYLSFYYTTISRNLMSLRTTLDTIQYLMSY